MNPIFFVCLDISGYLLIAWLSFYFQDRVLCFVFLSRELLSSGILNEDLDQNKFISPPRICFVEAWWVRSVSRSPRRWPRGEREGFFFTPGNGNWKSQKLLSRISGKNGNKKCHSDLRERDFEAGIPGWELREMRIPAHPCFDRDHFSCKFYKMLLRVWGSIAKKYFWNGVEWRSCIHDILANGKILIY